MIHGGMSCLFADVTRGQLPAFAMVFSSAVLAVWRSASRSKLLSLNIWDRRVLGRINPHQQPRHIPQDVVDVWDAFVLE